MQLDLYLKIVSAYDFTIYQYTDIANSDVKAGGLRVKKITSSDGTNDNPDILRMLTTVRFVDEQLLYLGV